MALPAQTFTVLDDFCSLIGCMDGRHPSPTVVQGPDGNLYGGTWSGGLYQSGIIFKLTPGGQLTTVYNFCSQAGCADGSYPFGPMVLGIDGNLYGANWWGGAANRGILFKMTPSGQVTTFHTFCLQTGCPDGAWPWGHLIQDLQGNFYGTASDGGVHGHGTVFRITPGGTLNTVHSFCALAKCGDGQFPQGALILKPQGGLYGITASGGVHGQGTVFTITASGTLTNLYNFCAVSGCADGAVPSSLVLGTDGNFYGTTERGGAMNQGTFFKLSLSGQLTTAYSFCSLSGCADGGDPVSLTLGSDGNFYGINLRTSTPGSGTIFEMTPSGSLTLLHTFCSSGTCTDGKMPATTGLFQHTNGSFYGVIGHGGNLTNDGTVFNLSTGLSPFVIAVPASGIPGTAVQILGTNLTGTTSVSFNGKNAAFTVASSSEILAKVPAGASSGPVRVVTPGSTLSSNIPFTVPQ
jgi:uncharacterized repeat protein (TIGR03803 family)